MTLPLRHFLLALSVVAIWGSNFVVIRWGLNAFPPLLFAALRFTFAAIPAVFLVPRPQVSWRNLAAYGALVGVGQFGLLYLAMRSQISPGLASLVIQTQVFFTLLLAMRLSGERVQGFQWLSLAMAAAGIGVIASHTDGSTTVLGLAMVLLAAFSWSSGNIVGKRAGAVNMLAYVVWSSVFAAPPLYALSLVVEGPAQMGDALRHAGLGAWGAVLWQSVGNTLFGYGAWSFLLSRYPAATIVPMALLVPVFGMSCSALLLGEGLPPWKLAAAALVISGLAVNLLWPRVRGVLRAA
ncbi:EamA family transporter [Roseateles sp. So40a]|uniref:EamA family transporter n=1 Tax=Roseateles sp. So40a TaxID=3400226 RepID=UPI003A89AEBD